MTTVVVRRTLQLAAGQVSYLECGRARTGQPSCVLLHGILGTADTFRPLMEALPPEWHLLALDLPGAGSSDREGFGTDLPTMAATVLHVLDALALQRPVLLGHSYGGAVALQVAATLPADRLRGLVLLAPAHPFAREVERVVLFHLSLPGRALARVLPWLPLWMYQVGRRAVTRPRDENTAAQVRGYRDNLRVPGTVGFLQRLLGTWQVDMRRLGEEVHRAMLPTPALLLWGDRDQVVPAGSMAELVACLPTAEVQVLADVGHLPAEERPAECARWMEAWLDTLGTGGE